MILALVIVFAASLLGRPSVLPTHSPWIVMMVGGGAAFLFVCSLMLWFRARNDIDETVPEAVENDIPQYASSSEDVLSVVEGPESLRPVEPT